VGYTGSRGGTGFTGDTGYTGSQGVGSVGYAGSRGLIGYTGSQGPQGTGLTTIPSSPATNPGFPLAIDAYTGLYSNLVGQVGISTRNTAGTAGESKLLISNTQSLFSNELAGKTAVFTSGTAPNIGTASINTPSAGSAVFTSGSGTSSINTPAGTAIFKLGTQAVAINTTVASDTTSGVQINADGNLEIIRSSGAYIDFKNSASEEFDFRIAQLASASTLEFLSGPTPGTSAAKLNNTELYVTGALNSNSLNVRGTSQATLAGGLRVTSNVIIDGGLTVSSSGITVVGIGTPPVGGNIGCQGLNAGAGEVAGKTLFITNYATVGELRGTGGGGAPKLRASSVEDFVYFTWNNVLNTLSYVVDDAVTRVIEWVGSSDKRLKTNISNTQVNSLSIINSIGLREFDWTDEGLTYNGLQDTDRYVKIGVIAQELEQIIPEAILKIKDQKEIETLLLKGQAIIPYLIGAIQQQQQQIDNLQDLDIKVQTLTDQLAVLNTQVKTLTDKLAELNTQVQTHMNKSITP
jgi:hypothetical protein